MTPAPVCQSLVAALEQGPCVGEERPLQGCVVACVPVGWYLAVGVSEATRIGSSF
jgi:hypothetical protein